MCFLGQWVLDTVILWSCLQGILSVSNAGWCPVTWTDMQRAGGGVGTAWVYEGTAARRLPLSFSLHAAVATVVPKGPAPGCTHQRCHMFPFSRTPTNSATLPRVWTMVLKALCGCSGEVET